jgi:hypothetical protein
MSSRVTISLPLVLLAFALCCQGQAWKPILDSSRAIDWSNAGVGGIPPRPKLCASLTPAASLAQINTALSSCPRGQTVFLAAGMYSIPGTIAIPSNVTLRGAGADRTILNSTGKGGYVVSMGSESVQFNPVKIVSGATAGSTSIMVDHSSHIAPGKYLAIAELNNPTFVSAMGSKANCDWCDGWTKTGAMARGQIVEVTAVRGDNILISPALYSAYTYSPVAVPFEMAVSHAGVEDLQVYANNTGYDASFGMKRCAYCWVKGVETNYTDGDLVELLWGYRDEVRDCYFSNAFLHKPGLHDSGIHVTYKTSASLFENNIIERGRASFELDTGAAGNVFAYNYTMGEFIADAPEAVIGGFRFHGAHPQFNLFEGNIVTEIDEDPVWGTSSHTTAFRNWVVGTNRVCSPLSGRGRVDCSGNNGRFGYQAARAIQISYLGSLNSFVGNLVGSTQMQSLTGANRKLAQVPLIEYPSPRTYVDAAFAWSFGYGSFVDKGPGSGCDGAPGPCHLEGTSATNFFHGNYNNVDGSIRWAAGVSHVLPASFYLPGMPSWWGSLPFPAIGPDQTGGSGPGRHSYGNPAQFCYKTIMGGSDGGAGSPLNFNAARCYGTRTK